MATEIKIKPVKKAEGSLFRACYSRGVNHTVTYILPATQRQAEEWESFLVEKREGLGVPAQRLEARVGFLWS